MTLTAAAPTPTRVDDGADHDLVVIGGGAGGSPPPAPPHGAAARTLLVDRGPLGGDCMFTGCVPSKALIAAGAKGRSFGDAMGDVRAAIATIAEAENDAVLRGEGVRVDQGWARFKDRQTLDIDGRTFRAPA